MAVLGVNHFELSWGLEVDILLFFSIPSSDFTCYSFQNMEVDEIMSDAVYLN